MNDRSAWKTLPPPVEREEVGLNLRLSSAEFAQIQKPLVPEAMEDKWYIYYADGWLRFHRSWTGAFIYAVRFERTEDGYEAAESWANRNSEQYRWKNVDYDREVIAYMIDSRLLKKRREPPKVPTEYMVHAALNDIALHEGLPAQAPRIEVGIALALRTAASEIHGRVSGRLILAATPSVKEKVALFMRTQWVDAKVRDFARPLEILEIVKADDHGHQLLLEDIVFQTADQASVYGACCQKLLGLHWSPGES